MGEKQSGLLESLEQLFVPRPTELSAVGSDAWFRTATELERIEWCCRTIFNELLLKQPIVQTSVSSLEEAQELLETGAVGLMGRFSQIENEDDKRGAYEDLGLVMEAILYFGTTSRAKADAKSETDTVIRSRRASVVRILKDTYQSDPVPGLMTNGHLLKLVLQKLEKGVTIGPRTLERARQEAWP